jgi:thioesterase domain-containing protein
MQNRFGRAVGSTRRERMRQIDAAFATRQQDAFQKASEHWKSRQAAYDFRAVLFRASDNSMWGPYIDIDEDLGWRRYLGDRLTIVDAIGGHRGIIEPPNVMELGRKAREFLGAGEAQ